MSRRVPHRQNRPRPAFPCLRATAKNGWTPFRCATRSGAGLKTGVPGPGRRERERLYAVCCENAVAPGRRQPGARARNANREEGRRYAPSLRCRAAVPTGGRRSKPSPRFLSLGDRRSRGPLGPRCRSDPTAPSRFPPSSCWWRRLAGGFRRRERRGRRRRCSARIGAGPRPG